MFTQKAVKCPTKAGRRQAWVWVCFGGLGTLVNKFPQTAPVEGSRSPVQWGS